MDEQLYTQANLLRACTISGNADVLQHYIQEFEGALNSKDNNGYTLLIYAVLADAPKCAALLLKSGLKINEVDKHERSALHWAAFKGSYQCLKYLLSVGANWEAKDADGATALHMAARQRDPKCLSMLLKAVQPKDVDAEDADKRTALHWAACCGHLENVKLLMKYKANSANPDMEGKTPVHWAAASKSQYASDCVKVLLERAPSAVNWVDYQGRGPLHFAVADGKKSVVRELISMKSCKINLLDNSLRTPLHLAAHLGRCNVVKLLLSKNANVCLADTNLATPLHLAILSESLETVESLLEKSIDVDQRDANGCSALMYAAGKNETDMMRCLVMHEADVQATDKHGSTALHIAALNGHVKTIEFLLEVDAVDVADAHGRPALSYACQKGHADAVIALLEKGSSLMHADHDGKTALHWAVNGGHTTVCELLVDKFSCRDFPDRLGRTALFYAASGGFDACLSILMRLQPDLEQFDDMGLTPLHYAAHQGRYTTVKLFVNARAKRNCLSKNKSRCTALDLALLNNHHDVAVYLLKSGGVSAVDIFTMSATKIQAAFRGYRVRKATIKPIGNRSTLAFSPLHVPKGNSSPDSSSNPFDSLSSQSTLGDSVLLGSDRTSSQPDKRESSETSGSANDWSGGPQWPPSRNGAWSSDLEAAPGKSGLRYVKLPQKPIKAIKLHRKKFQETSSAEDMRGSSMSMVNFAAAAIRWEKRNTRVRHHSTTAITERSKFRDDIKGAVESPPKFQSLPKAYDRQSVSTGHLEMLRASPCKENESLMSVADSYWLSNSALVRIAKEEWTASLFGSYCQRTYVKKSVLHYENYRED